MAVRTPLNLGQRGFSYGFRAPQAPQTVGGADLASLLQQAQTQGPPQDDFRRDARNYAMADVLSNQPTVESGSVAEALAEALAGGLRGRALRGERERELGAAQEARAYERKNNERTFAQTQLNADREYKQGAIENDYRNRDLAAETDYRNSSLQIERDQIAATRRGQDLDYLASQNRISSTPVQLRGADRNLMTRTQETAEGQRGLRGLVQEFAALQAQQRTGPGAGVNPLNGGVLLDPEIRGMDAAAARMRGLMRPTGSGATSDFEQRIYARGAPSIDNTPEQNAIIIEGINRATQIADQRQFFYEDYAQANGHLNGAERAFQASPEFRQLTEGYELPPANQSGQSQQERSQRIRIDANGNPVTR